MLKRSKYFHHMNIKNDVVAIYNSLILDVFYTNKKLLNKILKDDFDSIDKKTINTLVKKGILVDNSKSDDKALEILINHYMKSTRRIDVLYLVVSQGCNLGCKYCFLENCDANWKNIMMSFETAKIAIDKFITHVKRKKITEPTIMLFGGEPFYNWKILKQIVEYCSDTYPEFFNNKNKLHNLKFRTVTNGTLITESRAKFINKYNIVTAISLDGPKEINDANRVFKKGNVSVYDTVQKSIEILRKNNCDFGLSVTLSPAVVNDKENIIKWLKEMNVKNIFFNPLQYDSNNDEWNDHYVKSTNFIIDTFYTLLENDIVNGRPVRQIESFINKSFYIADCAAAGMNQLTIKPNGEVIVCQCDYQSEGNKLGNILEDDIDTLLNNKNTERWINSIPLKKEKCLNCESIFICGGSCLTQNTKMFDHSCVVDQTYCIYIKMMFEWLLKQWYEENVKEG